MSASVWIEQILAKLREEDYIPIKPKALSRKMGISDEDYIYFRQLLRDMIRKGQIEITKNHTIQVATPRSSLIGTFKANRLGGGTVKPNEGQGSPIGDIQIKSGHALDAATGDTVRVNLLRRRQKDHVVTPRRHRSPDRPGAIGKIVEVVERAQRQFVGTYLIRRTEAFVRVDSNAIPDDLYVGEATQSGPISACHGDKVVVEITRYPSATHFGTAQLVEVLGSRNDLEVLEQAVIRQLQIPDTFSAAALREAQVLAEYFADQSRFLRPVGVPAPTEPEAEPATTSPSTKQTGADWEAASESVSGLRVPKVGPRQDFTALTTVTIDPADARDHDDAISLQREENGFWRLGVHIADVSAFVAPDSALDREAQQRGTSVYLPGRVIPMFPDLISNDLASLNQDQVRLTKSVFITFDPEGRITDTEFCNGAIRVDRSLSYDQVTHFYQTLEQLGYPEKPDVYKQLAAWPTAVAALLLQMRELFRLLRARRRAAGFLELKLPEPKLKLTPEGQVKGAEYAPSGESYQIIEEFMLTANEAVAQKLAQLDIAFLRRTHEAPEPSKLRDFGSFLKTLNLTVADYQNRFEIQRILNEVADTPLSHAVHYALLRSLKEATYSPEPAGHYAIASSCYCHFTSPIRRYPDLSVHRLLDRVIRTGKASSDSRQLQSLGKHCSFAERRAVRAEREVVRVKLLHYLADRVGETMDTIVTGVEEYGLFVQGVQIPVEGIVHVRQLPTDHYHYDRVAHTLQGKKLDNTYRLGAPLKCVLQRVDPERRQVDFLLAGEAATRKAGATSSSGSFERSRKSGKPIKRKKTKSSRKRR